MKNKNITMQQIADDLQLSRHTISTVLNNNTHKKYVKPETIKRIKEYVDRIGYHQDISALAMRGKYSKDIVIALRPLSHEQRQIYFQLIEDLENLHLSYITTFYTEGKFSQLAKEIEFFTPQKIVAFGGFLDYKPTCMQWEKLRKNYFSEIPCFFFDLGEHKNTLLYNKKDACVRMSRLEALEEIAVNIQNTECTHLFTTSSMLVSSLKNTKIKIHELIKKPNPIAPENDFHTARLIASGKYFARQILEKSFPKGKTAVHIPDDYACCGAMEYLLANAVRVPEDIEFFSLGYMAENRMLKYPFTSWKYPYDAMYREMIKWIKGKKMSQEFFKIEKIIHKG